MGTERLINDRGGRHIILDPAKPEDNALLNKLRNSPNVLVSDSIIDQINDYLKLSHPSRTLSSDEQNAKRSILLNGLNQQDFGRWVWYPWNQRLVHVLPEELFIAVRTVRNLYKHTSHERNTLQKKTIGVVGLSVGQSVALCLAMERICGTLKIADFDTLELSNLNRIRTPLYNLGLKKSEVVAREIAEIDPYLNVIAFDDGISEANIHQFLDEGTPVDLLVEECDSVDIKLLVRQECKKRRIPVVMDTSDRGMIDIERFDVDPSYPTLHGLIDQNVSFEFFKSLKTSEEKLPYVLPIVGLHTMSTRMKASGLEVGQSITTWPQLGTDVALGGALAAIVSRRILLGENIASGRTFVDLNDLFPASANEDKIALDDGEISRAEIDQEIAKWPVQHDTDHIPNLEKLVEKANLASSPGNSQKWLWVNKGRFLYLFINKAQEQTFADNFHFGSVIGFGCAYENLRLACIEEGYKVNVAFNPAGTSKLVCRFELVKGNTTELLKEEPRAHLREHLEQRRTDRSIVQRKELNPDEIIQISAAADVASVKLHLITAPDVIERIGQLVCAGDRIRLMNKFGHADFFQNEIRWSHQEAQEKGDGLDIELFDLTPKEITGVKLAQDTEAVSLLRAYNLGEGFKQFSAKLYTGSSAVGILSIPDYSREHLFQAGVAFERIWLEATHLNIRFHPTTVLQMLFSRLHQDDRHYLPSNERQEVEALKQAFLHTTGIAPDRTTVLLFRLFKHDGAVGQSARKQLQKTLVKL